jgi:hypothetical protein
VVAHVDDREAVSRMMQLAAGAVGRVEARAVLIELACSVGEATQRSVAAHLGTVSEHAVGKSRKDLARMLKDDPQLRARFVGLKSSCQMPGHRLQPEEPTENVQFHRLCNSPDARVL